MASILGAIGGLSLGDVLSGIRQFGRVTISSAETLIKAYSNPVAGAMISIAMVKIADFLKFNPQTITSSIISTGNQLLSFNPQTVLGSAMSLNLQDYWNYASSFIQLQQCSSLDVLCNFANALRELARGVLTGLMAFGALVYDIAYYIAYYVLLGLSRLGGLLINYVIAPLVGLVVNFINYVADTMKYIACIYLQYSPILITTQALISGASRIFSRGFRRGLANMLLVGASTFLISSVTIGALVPECAYVSLPQVVPPPTPTQPPVQTITPQSYSIVVTDYQSTAYIASARNVLTTIVATDYEQSAEGSGVGA